MTGTYSRTAPGSAVIDVAGDEELNQSVAVQADGKLLIAGFSSHEGDSETTYDYSVVRLNANGTLDTTFGDYGRALIDAQVSFENEKYSLAVQADGSILVSSPYFGGKGNYDVIRLSSLGVPDAEFNANAQASIPDNIGRSYGAVSAAENGTVLVTTVDPDNLNMVRLNADGTPDESFGDHGYLTFASPVEWGSDAVQAQVLANGQLLVAGNLLQNEFPYAVMRVNTDGSLDTRFGHDGMVSFDSSLLSYGDGGITVQADGKVVLSGNSYEYDTANIVRLNADGGYDTSFGTSGVVSVPVLGEFGSAHSATVLADGKIIVGGDTDSNYSVIRLNSDGSLDTTFASPGGKNHLDGSPGDDDLAGLDTAETIQGLAGEDVLQGNHGRDLLSGGDDGDVFRFLSVGDSYRTATKAASDRVLDFNPGEDLIDLTALGFTGIGNGHEGTVAIKVNAVGTYTYLKNYDADGNGHRFEVAMAGDIAHDLSDRNFAFAASAAAASITPDAHAASMPEVTVVGVEALEHAVAG
ncbi:calcium-binding protein [Pseudomonas japonica]|uniref:calcium-binding protein n=1 Tax=Pseudomonas japonica TaxID=256466 RepID=UPI0015E47C6F|nr:calcium-binding protein [Pseudomonas japonica]MBA1242573.1 type I secretion target [Pseudomonas japonica]